MANTFTQMYVHIVFRVNGPALKKSFLPQVYNYIGGLIKIKGHKPLAIGGTLDHIHILVGLHPSQAVSNLVKDIKTGSSRYINENKFLINKFGWQEGFGAFTYSRSQISRVINYIENQEEHHKNKTFKEEYIQMLNKFNVDYIEKFI